MQVSQMPQVEAPSPRSDQKLDDEECLIGPARSEERKKRDVWLRILVKIQENG